MAPVSFATRGVLFDMDGVLISSTRSDERCWMQWARHHGMEGSFSLESTHGRRAVDTLRALRPELDPMEELRRLEDYDAEDYGGVLVLPGVKALLASLPADRWAVVTSASMRLLEGRLRQAGLPLPKALVAADHVSQGKPDPEPYMAGAALLGLAPAECVVIEDAPAGVRSGRAAGARVVTVLTSHTREQLPGADLYVETLEQVSARPGADGSIHLQVAAG